jgi:histidyl-tRNA synthetase
LSIELIDKISGFLKIAIGVLAREDVLKKLEEAIGESAVAQEGLSELKKMHSIWAGLGFDEERIVFDPTLMRGMAYYTGPVYEVESLLTYKDERGRERKVGSICGGGRYDGLVEKLLGMKVPATGASIGVDRLAELLRMTSPEEVKAEGPVLIAWFDDELQNEYYRMARELREAGLDAEVYCGFAKGFKKIKKQMAYADDKNCPAVILLGGNEAAKGVVTIKNLKLGKELSLTIADKQEWNRQVQQEVAIGEIVPYLKKMLGK